MRKNLTVRKWGSGLGVFLPKAVALEANLNDGDEVTQSVIEPGKIMIEKKSADFDIQDYGEIIIVRILGVSIPLRRKSAMALANKVGTDEGFSNRKSGGVQLSVNPDAGCLKLELTSEIADALQSELKGLGESR